MGFEEDLEFLVERCSGADEYPGIDSMRRIGERIFDR